MTSCSSSVSLQKTTKSEDARSKSCETVCTSNSSCYLQKRKPMNPLMYSLRPNYSRNSVNSVRQRVMSAKLLKLRSIQNQLNDANYHLTELTKENQMLKTLQKRQDKALAKYENTNSDLPRLIQSHEEQLRILNEKNKTNRKTIKELNDLLKFKGDELAKAQEKLGHLEKLNSDKRLLDREKLVDHIENLKLKLQKSDEQVAVLNRKLILEGKLSKQRLNAETVKHKQCQRELAQALAEIDRLSGLLETRENAIHPRKNRISPQAQRQSVSMVTLGMYNNAKRTRSCDKLTVITDSEIPKTPVTDIKLEPLKSKYQGVPKKSNGILDMPSENIRTRLSSASTRSKSSEENLFAGRSLSSESENSLNNHQIGIETKSNDDLKKNVPDDGIKIEDLTRSLDEAIQRATDNTNEEFDEKLADYCSKIMDNVRTCSERIEVHKESLKMSRRDTETLAETFKKTQNIESRLRDSLLSENDNGSDLLHNLFSPDLKVQLQKDNNENILAKGPKVKMEDRKRLLATLKAIDNGDSIDSVQDSSSNSLVQEILGDVSK